jgi:hypothetical protein
MRLEDFETEWERTLNLLAKLGSLDFGLRNFLFQVFHFRDSFTGRVLSKCFPNSQKFGAYVHDPDFESLTAVKADTYRLSILL